MNIKGIFTNLDGFRMYRFVAIVAVGTTAGHVRKAIVVLILTVAHKVGAVAVLEKSEQDILTYETGEG